MSEAMAFDEWARLEVMLYELAGKHRLDTKLMPLPGVEHPAVLMQAALRETFRPASPVESYSDDQPTLSASAKDNDWIPIDELLGCYSRATRTITIFCKNIAHFAIALSCDPADLELVVRLHEYAHALVHLGLFWKEEPQVIRDYRTGRQTNWDSFLGDRSTAFDCLSSGVHEFLAQLLSWVTIGVVDPLSRRQQVEEVFINLMARQPPHYVLSPDILGKAAYADPTALLSWARQSGCWSAPPDRTDCTLERQAAETLLRVTFP